ncbi:hypothetical protein [Nocardioides sp.]|uniref:hypothetical protein n=1 Tax=Nocardioides sp. TaxID=35761 RepID=UPI00271CDA24|nr:hypothetical protein [Nocardioides sp.]MDO9455757.1 hypothetical protein [Nocardioides sp.]
MLTWTMRPTRPHSRSRRLVLLGALAAPVAVAVLPAAPAQTAAPAEPECLADLIESGAVTRADLVAR